MSRKLVLVSLITLLVLVGTTVLQAQTDPGSRPVGKVNPALAICPPAGPLVGAKFPTAPNCIDTVQPAQTNPPADGAGNVIANGGNQTGFWFESLTVFETVAVVGPVAQTGGPTMPGLGPSFNGLSCFQCHSQPTVGGSSPNKLTPGFPNGNPQVGDAPTSGQLQAVSSFISATGPVREARFPRAVAASGNADEVSAGAVANLFVIQGRPDAPAGCAIDQEPFAAQVAAHNVIFRIPIPVFGEGFVENTTDDTLEANLNLERNLAANFFNPPLGITGAFNHSGNDQTISRFGWKAQNKSLLIFAGEASNVEMGVTNENFPNERTDGNGQCSPNFQPEDQTVSPPIIIAPGSPLNDPRTIDGPTGLFATFGNSGVTSDIASNIANFAVFMRLNGAPSQCNFNSGVDANGFAQCLPLNASAQRGAKLFGSLDSSVPGSLASNATDTNPQTVNIKTIGCVLCHSNALRTTTSQSGSLNNAPFQPFSDFAIHSMDSSLADGVTQGEAGSNQFRSAPLWGVGQRLFFLHDGRASDLLTATVDHAPGVTATTTCAPANGEACQVIKLFNALPNQSVCTISGGVTTCTGSKQDLLNFLRSL